MKKNIKKALLIVGVSLLIGTGLINTGTGTHTGSPGTITTTGIHGGA